MKTTFQIIIALLFSILLFGKHATFAQAQSNQPTFALTPDRQVSEGSTHSIDIALINMGIPLKRVELSARLTGDYDKNSLNIILPNLNQYGLEYQNHYLKQVDGSPNSTDIITIYETTSPQGYNQGSAQINLVQVQYIVKAGAITSSINLDTKLTGTSGQLIPYSTPVTRVYSTSDNFPSNIQDLQKYSISFESDPIRKWWPTSPNTVQQIDAALWKDSDGDNVKNFTALVAEWQIDSNYLEIVNTSSSFFSTCPVVTVSGRPCIRFAAHVKTKNPGYTNVMLKLTDTKTGRSTWNSYGAEIYPLSNNSSPSPSSSLNPVSSAIPDHTVSKKEFNEVQQKVTYLQSQLDSQNAEIKKTQNILNRVINFLKRLFKFSN